MTESRSPTHEAAVPALAGSPRAWVSAHIHFRGDVYGHCSDVVISRIVAPVVASLRESGMLEEYFFIRYALDGPHVRLRVLPNTSQAPNQVAAKLESSIDAILIAEAGDGNEEIAQALGEVELRWVPYEPELDRYGGSHVLEIAEHIFRLSSDLAIHLLREDAEESRSRRLGKALLVMLVTTFVFTPTSQAAARQVERFGRGYLRSLVAGHTATADIWSDTFHSAYDRQNSALENVVSVAWDALLAGDEVADGFGPYQAALAVARDEIRILCAAGRVLVGGVYVRKWQHCVDHLLPSLLHMGSNRQGVSIPEECYLAHLLAAALDRLADDRLPAC